MNKKLFEKVKDKCKDTRLSEKYLTEITDTLGDNIEDDSTDEEAIEKTATRIATVAKSSQGEATRWAQKAKEKDPKEDKDPKENNKEPEEKDPYEERFKAMENELKELKAKEAKENRSALINQAMEKHKIPSYLRNRLAKSISDDEDVDAAISQIKQDLITDGLMSGDSEGNKAASEKQVDEAADNLLESITVK